MIISINAMVCGDMTMVGKRRFMIAGSDFARRMRRGWKMFIDQGEQKFSDKCRKGASIGCGHEETAAPLSPGRQESCQAPSAFRTAR